MENLYTEVILNFEENLNEKNGYLNQIFKGIENYNQILFILNKVNQNNEKIFKKLKYL